MFAQSASSDTTDEPPQNSVYVTAGISHPHITPLNLTLNTAGYPIFSATVPSVGGRIGRKIGAHVRVGATGHAYLWGSGRGDTGRAVALRGGYGLLTVGYELQPLSRLPALRITPRIGAGAGLLRLRVSGVATSVTEALLSPETSSGSTIRRRSLLTSAGATVEYHLFRDTPAHLRLGIEGGYLATPTATAWHVDGPTSSPGPDAGHEGPFVRLIIGRGW